MLRFVVNVYLVFVDAQTSMAKKVAGIQIAGVW